MPAVDPGIVGPAYEAPMKLQDAERLVNWYTEISESQGAKRPVALLGCPGLNPILQLVGGEVRGSWILPGNTSAIAVSNSTAYLITVTVPATQNSIPQFAATVIGTLLTNAGPVVIRDNGLVFGGAGGFAVIVDGQFGYYYRLPGTPGTVTFTATLTLGSSQVPISPIPFGLVAGAGTTISAASGFIPPGTLFTGANFNVPCCNMSAPATNNQLADTITVTIPSFGQITDPAFLAASHIGFVEGWLLFNQVGSRTFFTNAATPYTLLFAGSFYALKDSSTDNLMGLHENNREVWFPGERTSEVWFNAGGTNFAFQRIPAVGPQIGCSAKYTITRLGTDLAWLARNEQGDNVVVMTQGYSYVRISNHGVEHAISSYPVISDARAYAYQEEGHLFYVLTFPTADVTWVYDLKTKWWHQRLSFDPNLGVYHRHRSNCFMNLADTRIVGDYQSGQLHQMSRAFYTDAGNPLVAQRRAPHVWSPNDRRRVFQSSLQVEFTPGVGLQSGQGSNPLATLRWSNDGGFTWSNEYTRSIGAAGKTRRRAIWRRLGMARDRVYELTYAEPTQRDIIGASLFAETEYASEENVA
jgi:hypothetical protein